MYAVSVATRVVQRRLYGRHWLPQLVRASLAASAASSGPTGAIPPERRAALSHAQRKKAFSGSTTASVMAAIMEREPKPLQTATPLDRVIRTCLAKFPGERFQAAVDFEESVALGFGEQRDRWAAPPVVGCRGSAGGRGVGGLHCAAFPRRTAADGKAFMLAAA